MATRYFFVGPNHVSSTQNLVLYISDETRENSAVVTTIRDRNIFNICVIQNPQNKPYDVDSIKILIYRRNVCSMSIEDITCLFCIDHGIDLSIGPVTEPYGSLRERNTNNVLLGKGYVCDNELGRSNSFISPGSIS